MMRLLPYSLFCVPTLVGYALPTVTPAVKSKTPDSKEILRSKNAGSTAFVQAEMAKSEKALLEKSTTERKKAKRSKTKARLKAKTRLKANCTEAGKIHWNKESEDACDKVMVAQAHWEDEDTIEEYKVVKEELKKLIELGTSCSSADATKIEDKAAKQVKVCTGVAKLIKQNESHAFWERVIIGILLVLVCCGCGLLAFLKPDTFKKTMEILYDVFIAPANFDRSPYMTAKEVEGGVTDGGVGKGKGKTEVGVGTLPEPEGGVGKGKGKT